MFASVVLIQYMKKDIMAEWKIFDHAQIFRDQTNLWIW